MNDQVIGLIRTVWQSILASGLAWLLSFGIDIDSAAAFAVTWPLVMAAYYFVAQQITKRVTSTKVSAALTGPGHQPTYDEVIAGLTGE